LRQVPQGLGRDNVVGKVGKNLPGLLPIIMLNCRADKLLGNFACGDSQNFGRLLVGVGCVALHIASIANRQNMSTYYFLGSFVVGCAGGKPTQQSPLKIEEW